MPAPGRAQALRMKAPLLQLLLPPPPQGRQRRSTLRRCKKLGTKGDQENCRSGHSHALFILCLLMNIFAY